MTSDLLASYEGPKQALDNCLDYRIETPNESRFYHGQLMTWLRGLDPRVVLLAGEQRDVGTVMAAELEARVETAGLVKADHIWDSEWSKPSVGTVALIYTTAEERASD